MKTVQQESARTKSVYSPTYAQACFGFAFRRVYDDYDDQDEYDGYDEYDDAVQSRSHACEFDGVGADGRGISRGRAVDVRCCDALARCGARRSVVERGRGRAERSVAAAGDRRRLRRHGLRQHALRGAVAEAGQDLRS